MFFILNHRNSIIAADKDFLSEVEACDVATASTILNSGEIKLDQYEHTIEINSTIHTYQRTPIYTLFGEGHMYVFEDELEVFNTNENSQFDKKNRKEIDKDYVDFFMGSGPVAEPKKNKQKQSKPKKSEQIIENNTELDEALFGAISNGIEDDTRLPSSIDEGINSMPMIDDIEISAVESFGSKDNIGIQADTQKVKTVDIDMYTINAEPKSESQTPSEVDYKNIANAVGVSTQEYKGFLYDFIAESKNLLPEIRDLHSPKAEYALDTLKEATSLLHLPHLTTKIVEMQAYIDPNARIKLADDFANMVTLVHIEAQIAKYNEHTLASGLTSETASQKNSSFPSIQNTQPIEFSYDIADATSALMLPKVMIEEFVTDFINQADKSMLTMRDAYINKDISSIKKSAHMLKGVAANLHIKPIERTLSILESNDSLLNVTEITKLFAGQTRYLKTRINI